MGLDMYLSKRSYVQSWPLEPKHRKHTVTVMQGGKPRSDIKPERVTYVEENVAYWRKANAIHRWFVETVQDGNDDCGYYRVSRAQLEQLKGACDRVLAASTLVDGKVKTGEHYDNGAWVPILEDGKTIADPSVAKEVLPTQDGFFFGSTEYDEFYHDDIVYTRDTLAAILAEPGDEFAYHSSW